MPNFVSSGGEPPEGWVLIPTGNVARTRLAKNVPGALACVSGDGWHGLGKTLGYYVPSTAAAEIDRLLAESEGRRAKQRERSAAQRAKREESYRGEFMEVLKELFPSIPDEDAGAIVRRATRVGSGKVGRASALDIGDKVTFAARAHARHKYTEYDSLLKAGWERNVARLRIQDDVNYMLDVWRERQEEPTP